MARFLQTSLPSVERLGDCLRINFTSAECLQEVDLDLVCTPSSDDPTNYVGNRRLLSREARCPAEQFLHEPRWGRVALPSELGPDADQRFDRRIVTEPEREGLHRLPPLVRTHLEGIGLDRRHELVT